MDGILYPDHLRPEDKLKEVPISPRRKAILAAKVAPRRMFEDKQTKKDLKEERRKNSA